MAVLSNQAWRKKIAVSPQPLEYAYRRSHSALDGFDQRSRAADVDGWSMTADSKYTDRFR